MYKYPVIDVSDWPIEFAEPLGSREKVWLLEGGTNAIWLFKRPRDETGEHWAEKVAAEVAAALDIPHARVELARRNMEFGSISLSFAPRGEHGRSLMLGNQLLHAVDRTYPYATRRPREHTVERVLRFLSLLDRLRGSPDDSRIALAVDVFVAYLLLDALIGNVDRHHENWGVLVSRTLPPSSLELAPTFDHASSLGRELRDGARRDRLSTRDLQRDVERYCARGRSPFFDVQRGEAHLLSPRDAFLSAAAFRAPAAALWLEKLREVSEEHLAQIVHSVSDAVSTDTSRQFAIAVLHCNRRFLLEQSPP